MALSNDESRIAWSKVVARAWNDDEFKQRLLGEPAAVMKEAGLDVPEGVSVSIAEQRPDELRLLLPARPKDMGLDDETLENIAGGADVPCICNCNF